MLALLLAACAPVSNTDVADTADADTETDSHTDSDTDIDSDTDTDTDPTWDLLVCASGGDYSSVVDAVAAADTGAVIAVCPGTYIGALTITMPLTLVSTEGSAVTMLDGDHASRVLTISGATDVTVEGFTLQHGDADAGPGLLVESSTATLADLDVEDCNSEVAPGVVEATDSTVDVSRLTIRYSTGDFALHTSSSTVEARNVRVTQLTAVSGVFWFEGGDVDLFSSIAADNSYGREGIYPSSDASVFISNLAMEVPDNVDGVLAYTSSSITVENSVLWSTGTTSTGLQMAGGEATVTYSDFFGMQCPYYSNESQCSQSVPGTGNLSQDPRFVDADGGDFTLDTFSPCIDAGDPAAAFDDPDGTRNDMGGYGGPNGSW
jgi:hypothetical protein